jgi:hypothetical protein
MRVAPIEIYFGIFDSVDLAFEWPTCIGEAISQE